MTGGVGCCARTPSGHAAAAPPMRDINSRRLMDSQPVGETIALWNGWCCRAEPP